MRRNTLTAELLAEFLGTFTLIVFGCGVVAHFVLRNAVGDPAPAPNTFGDFSTVNWAWGLGVVMGVYVAGGVSGAHINPAVTVSLAVRRGFPWGKVGPYIVAQFLGAFVAQVATNWTGSADRDWVVLSGGGRVGADREWLELAVDAIVENAVHFTEPGDRIEVSCRGERNGTSTVTIVDSGTGIPAADLPHVFERFWHRRPPGGMPGSGLGLAMAMAAVTAMGGSLTVSSTLGRGTRFTLSLPNAR